MLTQTPAPQNLTASGNRPLNVPGTPTTTKLADCEGKPAWLYTPTEKPDSSKTYWLLVGAHGMSSTGEGACSAGQLVTQFDDVIVLGPTFDATPSTPSTTQAGSGQDGATQLPAPSPATQPAWWTLPDAYQMSGPRHEAKLLALIADISRTWRLHPKIVLHGFSAGAQFAHRFAMHNPELVAGVSAHSAGSWAGLSGNSAINPAAREVRFAISCGEADNEPGKPVGTPPRIDGARQFAADLQSLGFGVQFKTWPGVKHDMSPGVVPMTKALVDQLRAVDR